MLYAILDQNHLHEIEQVFSLAHLDLGLLGESAKSCYSCVRYGYYLMTLLSRQKSKI